jgi:thiol-disulfide isomerase/thioredoxin
VTAALLFLAATSLLSSKIVRDGILADPHILIEAGDALRDAQYAPILEANRAAIETPFASSWKGAAKPEVTLVEFFDYACPYCKASNPAVDRLLQEQKGLRVVYRELPILGPDSVTAARLSLAASRAGRASRARCRAASEARTGLAGPRGRRRRPSRPQKLRTPVAITVKTLTSLMRKRRPGMS